MVQVSKFGIHYDERLNCNWLLQKTGGSSAIGLLPDFCKVTTGQKHQCPHNIDLKYKPNWTLQDNNAYTKRLSKLDITKFLLPIPNKNPYKKTIVYIECKSMLEEQCVLYLSSITQSENIFKYYKSAPVIAEILSASNISRAVVVSVDDDTAQAILNHLLKTYIPNTEGRLIIAGRKIPRFDYQLGVEFVPFPDKLLKIIKDMPDMGIIKEAGLLELRKYMQENVKHTPKEDS